MCQYTVLVLLKGQSKVLPACIALESLRHEKASPARPIPWPASVATSVTFPSRRIGRADGLEWAFLSYFTKKTLDFSLNKTRRPSLSLSEIFKKPPQILPKPTRSPPPPGQQYFPKDPLRFLKINPPSFLSLRNYHWKTLEFYLNYVTICSNRYYYNSNTIRTI